MNNLETERQEIEVSVEDAERAVSIYKALSRLKSNPDYQLIIETMYLKEQALDQMGLLAHDSMRNERNKIFEDLVSKSALSMFLMIIEQKGRAMEDDLIAYREMDSDEDGANA